MIVGALLCRNEADRYLKRVLDNLKSFCETIIVLDDHSEDNSIAVARGCGAQVVSLDTESPMWGNESPARATLWHFAVEAARGAADAANAWVYIADADHITYGDIRGLTKTWAYDSWALPLYDVWDEDEKMFRCDGYWVGHKRPRPWLFRPSACPNPVFSGRGMHAGHAPANFPYERTGIAPEGVYIAHLGWSRSKDREEKVGRYLAQQEQLSDFEREHVASVLA